MPKLYFRHGAVSSAKTLNLLAVAHNYKQQGKKVLLLKPALDTRFGKEEIKSRAGLQQEADVLIRNETNILHDIPLSQRYSSSLFHFKCFLFFTVLYFLDKLTVCW